MCGERGRRDSDAYNGLVGRIVYSETGCIRMSSSASERDSMYHDGTELIGMDWDASGWMMSEWVGVDQNELL